MPRSLSSSVATLTASAGGDAANTQAVESDISIARYRLDLFDNSTVGAVLTDRRADTLGYSNSVASIDAVLRPTNSDTVIIQGVYSRSKNPLQLRERFGHASETSGNSLRVQYNHIDAEWDCGSAMTTSEKIFVQT